MFASNKCLIGLFLGLFAIQTTLCGKIRFETDYPKEAKKLLVEDFPKIPYIAGLNQSAIKIEGEVNSK